VNVNRVRQKVEAASTQTLHFLDLSLKLSSESFFHPDEASEHLNQHGRLQLAEIIANEIIHMDMDNTVGVLPL